MHAYQFSMLGLIFDIVGAFLVSVEAIRLENLRVLRDRVLKRLEDYTLSPRIRIVDENGRPMGPETPPVPADRYPGIFTGLHYLAGLALTLVVNTALGGRLYRNLLTAALWALSQRWYFAVALFILFVLLGVVAGLWMLGELVHMSLTKAFALPIKAVDFIDAHTPDGTVGLIGFLLLLTGFALQMCGTYLGRPRI